MGMWLSWLVFVWNLGTKDKTECLPISHSTLQRQDFGENIPYRNGKIHVFFFYWVAVQNLSPVPSRVQRGVTMRGSLTNFLVVNLPPSFGENLVRKVTLTILLFASLWIKVNFKRRIRYESVSPEANLSKMKKMPRPTTPPRADRALLLPCKYTQKWDLHIAQEIFTCGMHVWRCETGSTTSKSWSLEVLRREAREGEFSVL